MTGPTAAYDANLRARVLQHIPIEATGARLITLKAGDIRVLVACADVALELAEELKEARALVQMIRGRHERALLALTNPTP